MLTRPIFCTAFSSLRVFAIRDRSLAWASVVLVFALVPFATNLVSPLVSRYMYVRCCCHSWHIWQYNNVMSEITYITEPAFTCTSVLNKVPERVNFMCVLHDSSLVLVDSSHSFFFVC